MARRCPTSMCNKISDAEGWIAPHTHPITGMRCPFTGWA